LKHILVEIWALAQRFRQEDGQDLIEYALAAALIALAAIAGISNLAQDVSNIFSILGSQVSQYT
jgi:Flp pilus assembly pilin Flp